VLHRLYIYALMCVYVCVSSDAEQAHTRARRPAQALCRTYVPRLCPAAGTHGVREEAGHCGCAGGRGGQVLEVGIQAQCWRPDAEACTQGRHSPCRRGVR
jgi:hypothetical protein